MDIGTAKPSAEERAAAPHHLLDLVGPEEDFSVSRFQVAARDAIASIEGRGKRALLVGGSGLYVRAVVDDLDVPGQFSNVRAELEDDPDTAALFARLDELDPLAASRMLPGNRRRVVRALEVTLGSGRPFSSFGPGLESHGESRFRLAGVWLPRAVVAERIATRYERQLAAGFLDEVRRLAPGVLSRTARQALGYRELRSHLAGDVALEPAVDEAIRRTRTFAARQRRWFRRDPRIRWYGSEANPVAVLPGLLGDWSG